MDEEHFFKATRMTVDQYNHLLNILKPKLKRFSRRKAIDEDSRLALTLLYLSQGCSINMLSWTFKIGISTVRKIIYGTCSSIWSELSDIYVAEPNEEKYKSVSEKFYRETGMPHCVGAIDGKHINIVCPNRTGSLYFNYKKTFSTVLLAVCDADYVFTLIDVGALGSQSDGGVFSRSLFGRNILQKKVKIPEDDDFPGTNKKYPYFFVADNAFPLHRNLLRPYPGRNLPQIKLNFNKRLSSARVRIENAFGILSNRWRILHKTIYADPKNVDKIVLATVALHNYFMLNKCIGYFTEGLVDHLENGVLVPGIWRETSEMRSCNAFRTNRPSQQAFELRDELAEHLLNN